MLKFAFLLGIVFISFNLIWFLFTSLLKMTLGETGNIEKYILRVSQSYFLASVSALATVNYAKSFQSSTFLIIAGAVVLFLYLINKIEQRKRMMQFSMQLNREYVGFNSSTLKFDIIIAFTTVAFYLFAVNNPVIVDIGINNWLFERINWLSNAFFIGWIIKIIGVFFIISIFVRGMNSFQTIYKQFAELINGKKEYSYDENEGFTDFEIVEEEAEEIIQIEEKD
ncbi:hypothetical protein N9P38_01515 [Flavobacteriales bacterium]|jgi:hypothetical protein|nr:hypothetical protein [Flavobacteriales bacterium]